MIPRNIRIIGQLTAAVLPLLSAPAWANPPEALSTVSALGLSGQQISPNEMRSIRGGFNLDHSLSISFAFKQIEAINGIIVKSIMVPETNVTAAATSRTASTITPTVAVTDAKGTTQTITPSSSGINLTTIGNNGQTVINTQFGANGLSNLTMNQANNTAISVAATANIAISGLSEFLTHQQSFANTQAGLYYAGSAFR